MITRQTKMGTIQGLEEEHCHVFLGIPYAKARRFEYASKIDSYPDGLDASKPGPACIQKRVWYAHLEVPERMFYHKEFREGINFQYSEDCLNLNIYTPKEKGTYPVIVFIHGGGFDSGANSESAFDGDEYAKRGIVTVFIQYRVGVFGYFAHEEIEKQFGHDGNFGLDDQIVALQWVKEHIAEFNGDPDNITAMGQSAGAISIQDMLLSKRCAGLFDKAIMMSGAGKWPSLGSPKPIAQIREYWKDVLTTTGCKTFEEFKTVDAKKIFDALEEVKARRKDNTVSTMPTIDNYYFDKPLEECFAQKIDVPTIVGFTNNDMFTFVLAQMAIKYAKQQNCYLYYFDVDAKGDNNKAFHSSDLRYAFGTLKASWRPYDEKDEEISQLMMDYFANFAKSADPNNKGLPLWQKKNGKALHFCNKQIKMSRPGKMRLLVNTLSGDPK